MGTRASATKNVDPGIRDSDRDALHILPLSMLPFETRSLKNARLVKNLHLDGVVELFHGSDTGSGQLSVAEVIKEFGWSSSPAHPDIVLLRKLAPMPSYDVYSLRILLRENQIVVNSIDALRLSDSKIKQLTSYMSEFTKPLIVQVYGSDDITIQSFDDIVHLFCNPDVKTVRTKLNMMADRLDITVKEIPKFLEDYGDIFLSLSYYRQCLDDILPLVGEFLTSLRKMRANVQLMKDQSFATTCEVMEHSMNSLTATVAGRLENFALSTKDMWANLSAERFRKVSTLIRTYHTTIGGILCGLSVKLSSWKMAFPHPAAAGPGRQSEFLMNYMRPGFERITEVEDMAPMLSTLA